MSLTKSDLIASISNHLNIPKTKSRALVESILETIKTTLASGEAVLISGFGKFYVKEKGKRKGRNPQTGGELMLRGRRVVGFKSSRVLKGKVNGKKRSQ